MAPPETSRVSPLKFMATAPADVEEKVGLLPRERYVASNRFQVRDGKAAAFEQRWATRKSRLANLDGFRYFTLLRRVPLVEVVGERGAQAMGGNENKKYDYKSLTIWEGKDNFDAWRNGDAFVEAHGGKGIGNFLKAIVSSLQVLKGAPTPVFYDGLLHLANPPTNDKKVEGGWRVVDADGVNQLDAECFVAANKFKIRKGAEAAFEERWRTREGSLTDLPGFKSFTMLRHDGNNFDKDPLGDDFNYMSFTVWQDKKSFNGWRNSQSFKDAHGGGAKKQKQEENAPDDKPKELPPWVRPPQVEFWEGVLELTNPQGA